MQSSFLFDPYHPLSRSKIEGAVSGALDALGAREKKSILLIPPDFTRYHSMAGEICQMIYKMLPSSCRVDLLPAVGTHMALDREEREKMFGDIPAERFLPHDWRSDTISLGTVPREEVERASGGKFGEEIEVEVNRRLIDGGYDLILSVGQVVPHEIVGMANYSKNIFVGVGGRQMINKSHMVSALAGVENVLGVTDSPARQIFDYAQKHYLDRLGIVYFLTVTKMSGGKNGMHGLFTGTTREPFEAAAKLSQELNITYVDKPTKKVVALMDEFEFKSVWVANKGIYRTCLTIADGGELILLAPGVAAFGENPEADGLIRKFGYKGADYIMGHYRKGDFGDYFMVAAHILQGCANGRFKITYATDPAKLSKVEVEGVGYAHLDIGEARTLYDPARLAEGWNTLPSGEEVYFVRNPALGLWKLR